MVWDNYLSNPEYTDICLNGSSRSGKTFLVVDYNVERAIAYPGSYHLFVRSTLTALTTGVVTQTFPNLWRAYKKHTGIDLSQVKTDRGPFVVHRSNPYSRFTFYNGSEVRFAGLDTVMSDPTALDKILSTEYLTITIEEAPEVDFKVVEMLKTRLAQKVAHHITGEYGVPKLLCTLNPRLFEDWDYQYFHKKLHPIDGSALREEEARRIIAVHFDIADNLENVSSEYVFRLEGMSASMQQRFLKGEHGDSFEGEVFKRLSWEPCPDIKEFERIVIYTDPSYKSGPKNDYKATMAIGLRRGAYWIIDGRAMQCTTSQMMLNVHEVYYNLVQRGWHRPVEIWFENKGMPDDFELAVQNHAVAHKWTCPYKLDNRDKGDKFSRIEAAVVPLNEQGKLFFNSDMKGTTTANLIMVQFLNFKHKLLPTEHDDIPDAVHGGITIMQLPTGKPGGTSMVNKLPNNVG